MPPESRDYDRDYRRPLPDPLQLRFGVSIDRGEVTRFMVQLEYWLDGAWREVVRYDHDPSAPPEMAHDVREEGLHMDIYRDGEKVDTETVSDPLPPNKAFNRAEEHLLQHLEDIVERFEQWHGIKNP